MISSRLLHALLHKNHPSILLWIPILLDTCDQLGMLQDAGTNNFCGAQDLFMKMVSTVLENGLKAELGEK